ncbi:MAG: CinA family protein, partial [Deltaproteobacteria bacterium]|nr:CinA family protein [Deltaproteobacteria bacterium]
AEMAEAARRVFNCEVGISATGIAGPTGAAPGKPVGLVHWAVAHPDGTELEHRVFSGRRSQVQHKAAHAALALLRRTLLQRNGS